MALLITQSLLSAWNYVYNCWDGQEDDAMQSFLDTLNRVEKKPTEAMLNGRVFEDEVYKEAAGIQRSTHKQWEKGIKAVAACLVGAPVQVKEKCIVYVGNREFLLYGILDALKAGIIYDVKFSKSYEPNKYLDSPQHPAYFELIQDAYEFRYLISDGTELFTETYRREDTRNIADIIAEFIPSITAMGLLPVYEEKWQTKY